MQALGVVTPAQLLTAGQQPLIKLEIYLNTDWISPWVNLCDAPVERDQEVLTDGGLEVWASATDLTHWTEFMAGAGSVNREVVTVHGGTYSCRLFTNAGGDYAGIKQTFTLTPNNNCSVSAWYIRAAHASSVLRLYIQDQDPGANIYLNSAGTWQAGATFIELPVSAVWKLFELSFTAHPGYASYVIKFYKDHVAGGGISFYIDDVSIAETIPLNVETGQLGNYLESASISLGGAAMTPNPVEGTWGATLFNENGVFHPQHPTSGYKDWLTTERLVRISVGGTYGGVDYYWQRIQGYMDIPKFSSPDYKVSIKGGDYMKRLRETEFRHLQNYWGSSWTTNSISSVGKSGAELYNEADAMEIPDVGDDNVANWVNINVLASTFVHWADVTGGSVYVGKMITTDVYDPGYIPTIVNNNIFVPLIDTQYVFDFKYIRIVGVPARLRVRIRQLVGATVVDLAQKENLWNLAWQDEQIIFTTRSINPIQIWIEIYEGPIGSEYWLDQFSIYTFTPYWERYYNLRDQDANEKGVHHITLTLINNGGFVANVNEWTAAAAVLTNVGGGQVGNCMQVASSGAALGKAYQDIVTVIGDSYKLSLYFKKGTSATGKFMIGVVADEDSIYDSGALSDTAWTVYSYTFVATATTTRITMQTTDPTATENSLFDEIILGPADVWQGEGDEGWYYTEDAEAGPDPPAHPAGIVFFDPNKTVAAGVNNLIIYYYLQQIPENVVADILVLAGLYAGQAAALADMQFDATGITVDKVWFEAGATCLDAIKKICERCDYRFYFRYDGVPFFKPKPAAGAAVFTFTSPKQIGSISGPYQSSNEIKNRIVIKGMKQAEPVNRDEAMPPKLKGEASDATSITAYGERTMTIDNHLFQTQAVIDAMCATLLAEYKDPKWYSDLKTDYLPVPLEFGDNIQWEERLSPTLDITQTGIVRDIKLDNYGMTYKCEHT